MNIEFKNNGVKIGADFFECDLNDFKANLESYLNEHVLVRHDFNKEGTWMYRDEAIYLANSGWHNNLTIEERSLEE